MRKIPLFLLMILVLPSLQAQEWDTYESEHFIFNYSPDHLTTTDIATIAENQEALFTEITGLLDIVYSQKIHYYLYGHREDFEGVPGAYCVGNEIRFLCIFCEDFCKQGLHDAHEMTHALADVIGYQHGLLAEGLAVYVEDYYIREANLHGIIKILYTEDRLTPLQDLVNGFWSDILFNYDIAGSFTVFLIEKYGLQKFKELYSRPLGETTFENVYEKPLADLELEWLSVVSQAEITQKEIDIVRYRDSIEEGLAIYLDLGFGPIDYGTYPARAEEGICLFRAQHEESPEEAFSHLEQFNQGMVAWDQAMETFRKALEEEDIRAKVELFQKALSLYKQAGDERMIQQSETHISAYKSLANVITLIQEGRYLSADEKLDKIKPVLQDLGEEEMYKVEQQIRIHKDRCMEGFQTGFVFILAFVIVMKGFIIRKIR